jgi:hypothetical protein
MRLDVYMIECAALVSVETDIKADPAIINRNWILK